jgi:hypothetical protein
MGRNIVDIKAVLEVRTVIKKYKRADVKTR